MLGIKYYVIDKSYNKSRKNAIEESFPNNFEANVPLGFKEVKELESNTFVINSVFNVLQDTIQKLFDTSKIS